MLISEFLTFFKRYMFIYVLFGHCYYVGRSVFRKYFICFYCILFIAMSCIIYPIFLPVTVGTLIFSYYTEFMFNCVLSLIFNSNYMNGIISFTTILRSILHVDSLDLSLKVIGTLAVLIIIRIVTYIYLAKALGYVVAVFLSCSFLFSIFVSYISKILFFDVLFHCMKTVRKALEYKYVEINVIGKERVKHRIKTIKACLSVYDYLVQHIENMDLGLEIWLFLTVLVYFPKSVLFMRNGMVVILNKQLWDYSTFGSIMVLMFTILVATYPAFLFELTKNEVDTIKDILFKQSLMDTDELLRLEVQRALQHIALRPCAFDVCRMMPLGVCLPLSFMSLCITYVIVLVQFTPVQ